MPKPAMITVAVKGRLVSALTEVANVIKSICPNSSILKLLSAIIIQQFYFFNKKYIKIALSYFCTKIALNY